nr:MAG: attachment glycoprotein [Jingmen rodent jeilongvirus 2]
MADYYKTGGIISPITEKIKEKGGQTTNILAYSSLVLGIISVLVLIALNATNIVLSIKRDGASTDGGTAGSAGTSTSKIDHIADLVEGDLLPKTNLINNIVSYNIPSSLTQIYNYMRRDLMQACTPKFDHNGGQCPVGANPYHSGSFSLLTRNFLQRCPDPNDNVAMDGAVYLLDFPSFVPGPTKPGGCMRDPSFSIGPKIFGYTHNVVADGCSNTHLTTQYVSIGRITDVDADMPYFETLTQWYIDDSLNRKTCTVAVADEGTWVGCIITQETDEQDYRSPGIGRIFLGYMDVYGRRMTWYLDEPDIQFSHNFAAIYFSVGSGIVENGKVYFLMYGGLVAPISGNVLCSAPGCASPNQDTCNQASQPSSRDGRQMVNAIMEFEHNPTETPKPKVKVINPRHSWFGARGRLFTSSYETYAFIYIASESWHTLPQIGMITLDEDFDVFWVENLAASRPGSEPCEYGNRCPQNCISGYYTDLFPLDSVFQFAITVTLRDYYKPRNPMIQILSQNKILYEIPLVGQNQTVHFTTTTCFKYTRSLWCLSIAALEPATVGARQPVPFLYKVPLYCKSKVLKTGLVIPQFEKSNKTQIMQATELTPPQIPIKAADKGVTTPKPTIKITTTMASRTEKNNSSVEVRTNTPGVIVTTTNPTPSPYTNSSTTRRKRDDTTANRETETQIIHPSERSRSTIDTDEITENDKQAVATVRAQQNRMNALGNTESKRNKPRRQKSNRSSIGSSRDSTTGEIKEMVILTKEKTNEQDEHNAFSRLLSMLMPSQFDHYVYHNKDRVDYDDDMDELVGESFTTGDSTVIQIRHMG